MAVVPTSLIVTPVFTNKRLSTQGAIAVYEKVALTVVGVVDVTDPDDPIIPPGLVLRITSLGGRIEYARFPVAAGDAWEVSDENAVGTLSLNTAELISHFACRYSDAVCEAEIKLEDSIEDNLYATGPILIRNWVQNSLEPVAGASQIQNAIDALMVRLEAHQHDGDTEGESSFPHNNLSGRDAEGVHPALESTVAGAVSVADQALATATVASDNASQALADVAPLAVLAELIQDGGAIGELSAASSLGNTKLVVNQILTLLNTWRAS